MADGVFPPDADSSVPAFVGWVETTARSKPTTTNPTAIRNTSLSILSICGPLGERFIHARLDEDRGPIHKQQSGIPRIPLTRNHGQMSRGVSLAETTLGGIRRTRSWITRCTRCIASFSDSNLRWEGRMPEKETIERAQEDAREGKSPSTQAGEFVREEMDHIREGKHGARSTKQAIAIGLSKARRAGVKLQPPKKGRASARTRKQASRDLRKAGSQRKPAQRRSRATSGALKRKSRTAASRSSLARQARSSARKRGATARSRSAAKAIRTKGRAGLSAAAHKASATLAR